MLVPYLGLIMGKHLIIQLMVVLGLLIGEEEKVMLDLLLVLMQMEIL